MADIYELGVGEKAEQWNFLIC